MTCLTDTFYYLFNLSKEDRENFTIIHAMVERPCDNLRHPHAIIYNKITGNTHEVSNYFKDNNLILPFEIWKQLGHVSDIKHYTFTEIKSLVKKTRRWDFYHLLPLLDPEDSDPEDNDSEDSDPDPDPEDSDSEDSDPDPEDSDSDS